jgi:hypothetical protein
MVDSVSHWSEEPEGGYIVTPALTWFDCSKCGHAFHIGAAHREAVEAHHQKRAHAGDQSAILEDR